MLPESSCERQSDFRASTGQFRAVGVVTNFAHKPEKLLDWPEVSNQFIERIQGITGISGHG
jgi:hypothetical protein